MKKSDIIVGHIYSNGKGRVRMVVDVGPQYKAYDAQESRANLLYKIIYDWTKDNLSTGKKCPMTISAFATWAKEDVTDHYIAAPSI